MKYEIKGGSFPVVICNLENGEKMITEKGSMAWMSPNMQMETHGGGLAVCSPRHSPVKVCSRTTILPEAVQA